MKMWKLYCMAISLILLASCMGTDEDKQKFGAQIGVVQLEPEKCIHISDGEAIYATALDTMDLKAGDCCLLDYVKDYSTKEVGYGYAKYQAQILKYDPVRVLELSPSLTDTTRVLDKERILSFSLLRCAYFKGRFFLFTELSDYVDGETSLFDLSYNPKQGAVVEAGDNRVYNLYLRASKGNVEEGQRGSRYTIPVAFDLEQFVEEASAMEKSAGLDTLKFKFNYPRNFNVDTTACIWTTSDLFTMPIY